MIRDKAEMNATTVAIDVAKNLSELVSHSMDAAWPFTTGDSARAVCRNNSH